MRTLQLYKLAKKKNSLAKIFRGVYPLDFLPGILLYPSAYIYNLDPSYLKGKNFFKYDIFFTKINF